MKISIPFLVLALAGSAAAQSKTSKTVEGELVDMGCYLIHGARGEKHAKCAGACIAGGAPMGVLAAGSQLYLLVADSTDQTAYLAAKALGPKKGRFTGRVVRKGGFQALVVSKVEGSGGAGRTSPSDSASQARE